MMVSTWPLLFMFVTFKIREQRRYL